MFIVALGSATSEYVARSSEIFCKNSSRVSPFSIKSFASASVWTRLETRSSSIVTGPIDHIIRSQKLGQWEVVRRWKGVGTLSNPLKNGGADGSRTNDL